MGLRNPWRLSRDSRTGFVYWGEIGPDAGEDTPNVVRGYDELNQARKPGNFGWPYFIGDNFAYPVYDYDKSEAGPKKDPAKPINTSVNNTGLRQLPPAVSTVIVTLNVGANGKSAGKVDVTAPSALAAVPVTNLPCFAW